MDQALSGLIEHLFSSILDLCVKTHQVKEYGKWYAKTHLQKIGYLSWGK